MVAILHKRDSNLNRKENRTFCLPCYWLLTFFLFFLFCRFGVDLKQTKATERKKQKKRNSHTLIGCRKFFLFSFLLRFESRLYFNCSNPNLVNRSHATCATSIYFRTPFSCHVALNCTSGPIGDLEDI